MIHLVEVCVSLCVHVTPKKRVGSRLTGGGNGVITMMMSVARQGHEVEKLRDEVKGSRIGRDSLMEQLSTNGKVLCDLERSVSSLYGRLHPV